MNIRHTLAAGLTCVLAIAPVLSSANPWEVQREVREGARNVELEKREARREIRRCETRGCVVREVREGEREVNRERREAREEIQAARRDDDRAWRYERERRYAYAPPRYYGPVGYSPPPRAYGPVGYYGGGGRAYDTRYYYDPNGHYHPDGRYCVDARHMVHLRDAYYRGDRRWYRDGRYWNEPEYVEQYYREHRHRDHDGNDDLIRGAVIGAAVVGVIAAIHEANEDR